MLWDEQCTPRHTCLDVVALLTDVVSEIGGNAIAAAVSNVYHAVPERSVGGTLTRWGMQVRWDTLSNEMKEFWPDIRARLYRHADTP